MRRLILALILWPGLALSGPLPEPTSDKVNDWAEVISANDEAQLAANLAHTRRETGVHVVVVTMNDHADYGGAGESLENYATRLFNAWGIGDAKRHDGVLVLVTPGRRAMRIELGRGYGTAWDRTAKGIIDDSFLPAFADGDIEGGVLGGTDQVLERIARRFGKGLAPKGGSATELWLFISACITFFALFLGTISYIVFPGLFARFYKCPQCGRRGMELENRTDVPSTSTSEGKGTRIRRCRHCSYVHSESFFIPEIRSSDRSSSGGSGFGGGSSSGGGASGRW